MPNWPNRLGRLGTLCATPTTGGFVMRITPNRLTSELDRDHTVAKADSYRLTLQGAEQTDRQPDERIRVAHLLCLVHARLANLCGRTTTLASFTTTQQGITQAFKGFTLLWLRGEQFNGTVEGRCGNLTTGLVVQAFNTDRTFRQHKKGNLLRRDADLADGLRRGGESDGHGVVLV